VHNFARANNLRRSTGSTAGEYRYEQDVEQFFRHSPAVVRGIDT
jgi:UDP-glucose 4-epimerase